MPWSCFAARSCSAACSFRWDSVPYGFAGSSTSSIEGESGMNPTYAALAFALTFAFVLLLAILIRGKSARVEQRLKELCEGVALPPEEDRVAEITQTTLSKIGQPLLP